MLNCSNRVHFVLFLRNFLHRTDATPSFQTLKSKGAFSKCQGAPRIASPGDSRLIFDDAVAFGSSSPSYLVSHRGNPLGMTNTDSLDWTAFKMCCKYRKHVMLLHIKCFLSVCCNEMCCEKKRRRRQGFQMDVQPLKGKCALLKGTDCLSI